MTIISKSFAVACCAFTLCTATPSDRHVLRRQQQQLQSTATVQQGQRHVQSEGDVSYGTFLYDERYGSGSFDKSNSNSSDTDLNNDGVSNDLGQPNLGVFGAQSNTSATKGLYNVSDMLADYNNVNKTNKAPLDDVGAFDSESTNPDAVLHYNSTAIAIDKQLNDYEQQDALSDPKQQTKNTTTTNQHHGRTLQLEYGMGNNTQQQQQPVDPSVQDTADSADSYDIYLYNEKYGGGSFDQSNANSSDTDLNNNGVPDSQEQSNAVLSGGTSSNPNTQSDYNTTEMQDANNLSQDNVGDFGSQSNNSDAVPNYNATSIGEDKQYNDYEEYLKQQQDAANNSTAAATQQPITGEGMSTSGQVNTGDSTSTADANNKSENGDATPADDDDNIDQFVVAEPTRDEENMGGKGKTTTMDCPIDCNNHGLCRDTAIIMAKDSSSDDNQDGGNVITAAYYCDCIPGFTGPDCSIPVETCSYSEFKYQVQCYNSGECLNSDQIKSHNPEQNFCNCDLAGRNGVRFGGKFCEEPVTDYELCTTPLSSTDQTNAGNVVYCLNGGSCQLDSTKSSTEPCTCPKGFHGNYCQFRTIPNDCTLNCLNGGTCQMGANLWGSQNGMYCACPPGYAGVTCESPTDYCGMDGDTSELVCINGAVCVTTTDGKNACDCSSAHTAVALYAGPSCQHEHTEVCTLSGDFSLSSSIDSQAQAFCVNGGKCKALVPSVYDNHSGCHCPPQWKGLHCEVPSSSTDSQLNGVNSKSSVNKKGRAVGIFFLLAVVAGLALFAGRKIYKRRREEKSAELHAAAVDATNDLEMDYSDKYGDDKPEQAQTSPTSEQQAGEQHGTDKRPSPPADVFRASYT